MSLEDIPFTILKNNSTSNKTQYTQLTTKVKTIYHISDIHIHLYKRHGEYKQQFEKLYSYLEKEKTKKEITDNVDIEMVSAITGDILHCKSDLSPECIDMTYNFIKQLSQIMPVIIIPGNHDLNMNNKNRLDSISPILADLPSTHPIYYLQSSGVYLYSNLVIMHASIFDYNIIPANKLDEIITYQIKSGKLQLSDKQVKGLKKISMYHGRVNGCEIFNGIRLEGEKTDKKTITPADFNGYDIGLCGDIHLHQNITESGNVAYAGSLIQQNLGESLEGHGVLKWSLKTGTYKFKEIKNDYGYVTLDIKDGKIEDETIVEKLPKNLRMRILYTNTTSTDIENIVSKIKENHTIIEYNVQNSASLQMSSCSNYNDVNTLQIKKEINIQDVEYQNTLLEEIIKTEIDGVELCEIDEIKTLNKEVNKLLQTELETNNKGYNENNLQGNQYKFISLEFSNLYSYGPNNIINFKELNGVVGIVAPNHMGKSAIIDILLYALFDKFPRKGSIKDIVNIRKDKYYLKLVVACGHYEYIIEKSAERTKTDGMGKAKCEFLRRNTITNEMTNLAKDTIKSTREYISQYFGHYEDVINTNFSIQTNSTGFIDADNCVRRKELERIMRFDYIELLAKKINEQLKDCKAVVTHLQNTMPPEKIKEIMNEIDIFEKQINDNTTQLQTQQELLDSYQSQINNLNQKLNLDIDNQIEICLKTLECSNINDISMENVDAKLNDIITQLQQLNVESSSYLFDFKKLCKKGVIQRLDVPNKNDILDFCDKVEFNNILSYKGLIKSFIKEYKKWDKDQNIEKQVKLKSLHKQIRELERKQKPYNNDIVKRFTSEENIKHTDILQEFELLLTDLNNVISTKQKEVDEFDKVEKDIASSKKKINKVEKTIKGYEGDILTLTQQKIPESLMTLIKSYQNNISDTNKYSNTDILGKFDNVINTISNTNKDATIKSVIDFIKELKIIYKYEQDNGFTSWVYRYIKDDENINAKILDIQTSITKEEKKIVKYNTNISILEGQLEGKHNITKEIERVKDTINTIEKDKETYLSNIEIHTKITEIEIQRDTLEEELSGSNNEISSYIDKLETLWGNITDNVIKQKDMELEVASLEKVSSGLDELLEQLEQNTNIQEEILDLTKERNTILEAFNKLNQDTQTLRDKYSSSKGQLEKMKEDCAIKIEKERMLDLLNIYKMALKFIPMILINKIKPILSRKVNDLLGVVTNFTLEFDFDDNKIDIYLTRPNYNNKRIIINNSSGFERFISSIAIRLALMEVSKLPSPNVMIIDEGWSCFDNENINNMDVILTQLKQRFDFILTISHLQIIRQHCDIQIGLVKDDNGFSQVRYG